VPNFVIQDGDPRGDGNGGPGYQIRCEINQVLYDRAAVGMALSGKDTGGSQWFVTHSPQPHLDGGYTVFGRVVREWTLSTDRARRRDSVDRNHGSSHGKEVSPKCTKGTYNKERRSHALRSVRVCAASYQGSTRKPANNRGATSLQDRSEDRFR
jgi:cyclophilin family peptidyl-prolyl cis-trans isomerase